MKIVITAGPTREPIDPVRYISNRSSGKMGYAIASAAVARGCRTTLISGPTCLPAPDGVEMIRVTTAAEMGEAVDAAIADADALIMAAAVADFTPANPAAQKLKKDRGLPSIVLQPTRDILASVVRPKKTFILVGFAAETENIEAHAKRKLSVKHCDFVVANDVSGFATGFDSDENIVTLYFQSGDVVKVPRADKRSIGTRIIDAVFELTNNH